MKLGLSREIYLSCIILCRDEKPAEYYTGNFGPGSITTNPTSKQKNHPHKKIHENQKNTDSSAKTATKNNDNNKKTKTKKTTPKTNNKNNLKTTENATQNRRKTPKKPTTPYTKLGFNLQHRYTSVKYLYDLESLNISYSNR